jgi:hypothetical protein
MNDTPISQAKDNAKHMWRWVTATIVLFVVYGTLQSQMDEKYRGFFGSWAAAADPAGVHQLSLWILVVVLASMVSFAMSCYKIYWRWVSRVLPKHRSEQ